MNRVILSPAVLPASALAELKQWLGITAAHDDAPLSALLAATIDICEAFTGQMPLEAPCEEVLTASPGWHSLSTRPVQTISSVEGLGPDGVPFPLDADSYEIELEADGTGRVRLPTLPAEARVAVRFTAVLHCAVAGESAAPPLDPAEGENWLVAAGATGDWTGQDLSLACRQGGNWLFVPPRDGMRIFDLSAGQERLFSGFWRKAYLPAEPNGGSTVDAEARTAINELITALQTLGVLPTA